MTLCKAEIQNFLELTVRTTDEYVSIRMNLNNWKKYTNGNCTEGDVLCGKQNSFLLQVRDPLTASFADRSEFVSC